MNKYSVLMSVYDKEKPEFLQASIDSMLSQTVPSNDFVIVCDGPLTFKLDMVLGKYSEQYPQINIVRLTENKGLGDALNEGMKHCKNELIARMDSDDISRPNRCKLQLETFAGDESVDIVSGTVAECTMDMEKTGKFKKLPCGHAEILRYAKKRNPFNHPCVMYKKTAVLSAGGYQSFYLLEDYFLWIRMLMNDAKGYNIDLPLLDMRAGADMYRRRGGGKYLQSAVRLRQWMKKNKFIGWGDFLVCVVGQSIVYLLPNSFRGLFYRRFLRK